MGATERLVARFEKMALNVLDGNGLKVVDAVQYDLEEEARQVLIKSTINTIGDYCQSGRVPWQNGRYMPAGFNIESIVCDSCCNIDETYFGDEVKDACIVLQNLDIVKEVIDERLGEWEGETSSYCSNGNPWNWANGKGIADFGLSELVFAMLEHTMGDVYPEDEIGLSSDDIFYNDHCLSAATACVILDELGFSDYKKYGITWINEYGYDEDGYNEKGYDEDGYNREGYDEEGYDREGYDEEGFDEDGNEKLDKQEQELQR